MNLEADQAVQEARFAGACQDQHAGRPAGWPGERKSIMQQAKQMSFLETKPIKAWGPGSQGLGAQGPGPPAGFWGRALQGLGVGASSTFAPGPQGLESEAQ